jgi:AAA+ superfamily predicted ATPase
MSKECRGEVLLVLVGLFTESEGIEKDDCVLLYIAYQATGTLSDWRIRSPVEAEVEGEE